MNEIYLPLVTVYIPTKNRKSLLERAVNSILSQSYENIEIVICSDGSNDGTVQYAEMLTRINSRIIFLHNEVSKGACNCRNRAINASTGEYVTGLDDDDYFLPNHIENFVLNITNDKNIILFTTQSIKRNERLTKNKAPEKVSLNLLVRGNILGNQVFAHRTKYFEAGLFNECLPAWQDYDLWLRIGKLNTTFKCIDSGTYVVDVDHPHERITKSSKNIDAAFNIFKEEHADIFGGNQEKYLIGSYLRYASVQLNLTKFLNLLKFGDLMLVFRVLSSRYRKLVKTKK